VRARRLDVRDERRARLGREAGRVDGERLARAAEDAPGGVLGVRLVGEEEAARVRRAKPAAAAGAAEGWAWMVDCGARRSGRGSRRRQGARGRARAPVVGSRGIDRAGPQPHKGGVQGGGAPQEEEQEGRQERTRRPACGADGRGRRTARIARGGHRGAKQEPARGALARLEWAEVVQKEVILRRSGSCQRRTSDGFRRSLLSSSHVINSWCKKNSDISAYLRCNLLEGATRAPCAQLANPTRARPALTPR
jgi:hypothetical protein